VAVGLGVYPSMDAVDDLIKIRREVEPNTGCSGRYDALYHQYRDLYDLLVPVHRKLYQIQ
jgi:hypothetical protein